MCCLKCEEKVKEEIWEVPGVFDVRATRPKKVIVVSMPEIYGGPFGFDENEVLRKARKIDCRAKIVELDRSEQQRVPEVKRPPVVERPKPKPEVEPPPFRVEYHQTTTTSWSAEYGRPSEPPYQEDYYVHYFHLLLLALFVLLLILR